MGYWQEQFHTQLLTPHMWLVGQFKFLKRAYCWCHHDDITSKTWRCSPLANIEICDNEVMWMIKRKLYLKDIAFDPRGQTVQYVRSKSEGEDIKTPLLSAQINIQILYSNAIGLKMKYFCRIFTSSPTCTNASSYLLTLSNLHMAFKRSWQMRPFSCKCNATQMENHST